MERQPRVCQLLSADLVVPDLKKATIFYEDVWGLSRVAAEGESVQLMAGKEPHYALSLSAGTEPALREIRFAALDAETLSGLHAQASAFGVSELSELHELPAGGGLEFSLLTPDGLKISIRTVVTGLTRGAEVHAYPTKLSHIVLNSPDAGRMTKFFIDILGFLLSDSTKTMQFIRCSSDHHSIAMARGTGVSVNHIAFEMTNIDSLMYGAGRLSENGFSPQWGLGRHGPGNNVFCYFVDPNGYALEYTTEMQQILNRNHEPGSEEYWSNFPRRPCRWNMAGKPSAELNAAFSGLRSR